MCATDMLYFGVARDGLDGGAQITASHNPGEYNGIKMVRREAFPLSGDAGIGEIRDMVTAGPIPAPIAAAGRHEHVRSRRRLRARRSWASSTRRRSSPSTSCSTPAAAWRAWSRRGSSIGCPAGRRGSASRSTARFRTTRPIPLIEENRVDITERVIAEKADIGIAWDGDADRCFFLDGTGEFIAGDFITALLAEAALQQVAGQTDRLRRARELCREGHRRAARRHARS